MMNAGSQFHALPEELLQFVLQQIAEFSLHAATIRHFPYDVAESNKAGLPGVFADPTVYTLMLTVSPPVLPVSGLNDLLDRNPDALLLDIGRRSEKGLGESWIRTRASAPKASAVWKKVFGRFKRMTRAGATAVNPETGARCRARDQRYTEKAKALNEEGVTMLPTAGSSILQLG